MSLTDDHAIGVDDMINLTTLSPETMVSNLSVRFENGLPYTLCGQIYNSSRFGKMVLGAL